MSDPFEPGDEYALMHCPECGFEWEQLLMYEPDQQGWKRPACKHDITLANEVAD